MGTPQLIMILLLAWNLCIHITKHGEDRTGSYNAFHCLIATVIQVGILIWGGFFT